MAELRLIHGRKSIKYNHFEGYEFRSCRAITSRLMGVTALKVKWRGKENDREVFYQIIHLDYSEYGIDEYREFECIPGEDDQTENKHEMRGLWNHFISVMGSDVNDIDAGVMMRLIADALPLAGDNVKREYDSEENREFRQYALLRIGYMMDALHEAGFSEHDCSSDYAINAVMPVKLSAFETINYFVMRLVDHDFSAALRLTNMNIDVLRNIEITEAGIQTLMKCNIDRGDRKDYPPADGTSYPYCCRAVTLAGNAYYYYTFVIWLSGNIQSKNPLVTDLKIGSSMKLSDYEAAIQISRPEYITVFGFRQNAPEDFDLTAIAPFRGATEDIVPNGVLYTAYKPDNSHVDRSEYRLEGDVTGHALLSPGGEITLMSHDMRDITLIDNAFAYSAYTPYIEIRGRFMIETPVFQTLCMSPGASFTDLTEHDDEH